MFYTGRTRRAAQHPGRSAQPDRCHAPITCTPLKAIVADGRQCLLESDIAGLGRAAAHKLGDEKEEAVPTEIHDEAIDAMYSAARRAGSIWREAAGCWRRRLPAVNLSPPARHGAVRAGDGPDCARCHSGSGAPGTEILVGRPCPENAQRGVGEVINGYGETAQLRHQGRYGPVIFDLGRRARR